MPVNLVMVISDTLPKVHRGHISVDDVNRHQSPKEDVDIQLREGVHPSTHLPVGYGGPHAILGGKEILDWVMVLW